MLKRIVCFFLGHQWRPLPYKMKVKCKRCGLESEFIDIPYGHSSV